MTRPLPQISVVTVVWNNLDGLKITADSIQQQCYEMIQHVIIDGDSQDGTPAWLEGYRPRYASKVISEPDDGLYEAMNKGLSMADGDLVIFLNGGDTFCDSDVLSVVAQEWSRGSWAWGYGGINYIDSARKKLSSYHLLPFAARRVQLGMAYVPHPATFMSRDLLDDLGGFRPEFGWSADQELGVRAALRAQPFVLDRHLTDFLVGGAHSQGSLRGVARRYSNIRKQNELLVLSSAGADLVFTELQGTYWSCRAWASSKLKSKQGVDSSRRD